MYSAEPEDNIFNKSMIIATIALVFISLAGMLVFAGRNNAGPEEISQDDLQQFTGMKGLGSMPARARVNRFDSLKK